MGLINSSHNQPLWPWHFFEGTLQRWGFNDDVTSRSSRNDWQIKWSKQFLFLSQYGEKKHTSFFVYIWKAFFWLNTTNFFLVEITKSTKNSSTLLQWWKTCPVFQKKTVLLPPQKNPMLLPGESFSFATPKSLQRSQFQTKILSEGYLPVVIWIFPKIVVPPNHPF